VRLGIIALFFAVLATSCAPRPAMRTPGEATADDPAPLAAETQQSPEEPARHEPVTQFVELEVPDHLPAVVALPDRGDQLVLVIAAHGAGGSPEWQCQHWALVVAQRGIVLCPRGRRISLRPSEDGMYYYPDHFALEREFVAMVSAARARFGARLAAGGGIYTGFSQGATMGALMIVDHGETFPFLILVEGATSEFSPARAKRFAAGGGKSVAFVCGGQHCASGATRMAGLLQRAGLEARAEHVPGGGHTDSGAVGERAREVFEAFLAELRRGR
jgi:predicted esterase